MKISRNKPKEKLTLWGTVIERVFSRVNIGILALKNFRLWNQLVQVMFQPDALEC